MEIVASIFKVPFKMIWLILKSLFRFAGNKLVKPILDQSHEIHLALRRSQLQWENMGGGLEYKAIMESVLSNGANPRSRIYVRNASDSTAERYDICVVARQGKLQHPEFVTGFNLKPSEIAHFFLLNIPLQRVWADETGIQCAYDSFHVFPVQVVRHGQTAHFESPPDAKNITHDDFLNGQRIYFMGRWYNADAIEEFKANKLRKYHFTLVGRHGFVSVAPKRLLREVMRQRCIRFIPNILVYSILTQGRVLSINCWASLLLRRESLKLTEA